jgi:type IV pilus assembly protein PilB
LARLGEILVMAGVLDEPALRKALAIQRTQGGPLGRILVENHIIDERALVRALSMQLKIPEVDLDALEVADDVKAKVSLADARTHMLVPMRIEDRKLHVAMADPPTGGAPNPIVEALRVLHRMDVVVYLAGPLAIERAIERLYG